MNKSKSRFRFNDDFDLHLAREVYGQTPFEDSKRWSLIQVNMIQITGRSISIRTLRDRIVNLVKKYSIRAQALEGKSGIKVCVTELDDLLQQIAKLISEYQKITMAPSVAESKSSDKSCYQKGYNTREMACTAFYGNNNMQNDSQLEDEPRQAHDIPEFTDNITNFIEIENCYDQTIMEDDVEVSVPSVQTTMPVQKRSLAQANIIAPKRKRSTNLKQTTVQYLEIKNEKQHEMRCRELELQEKKQLLEERKFEIDKQERLGRLVIELRMLHMEEKRLKIELDLFANQQELK